MAFIGTGPEDWPEFDLDGVEYDARTRIVALVEQHRPMLEAEIGEFELEHAAGARVFLTVDRARAMQAQVTANHRLLLTPLRHDSDLL